MADEQDSAQASPPPASPDHPLVGVERSPGRELPYLLGTDVYVWQVVEVWQARQGSLPRTAAFLGLAEAAVRAGLAYYAEEGAGYEPREQETRSRRPGATVAPAKDDKSVVQRVGEVFALFAGLATLVYVTGGIVLALRLAQEDLPWEPVVGQLPREFLISVGLAHVLLPALGVALVYASFRLLFKRDVPRLRPLRDKTPPRSVRILRWTCQTAVLSVLLVAPVKLWGERTFDDAPSEVLPAALALAVLCAAAAIDGRGRLASGGEQYWHSLQAAIRMTAIYAVVFVPTFIAVFAASPLTEARVCNPAGFSEVGILIGQTGDRVYIGEQEPQFASPDFKPNISVHPLAQVEELFIGREAEFGRCDPRGAQAAVLANFEAERARKLVARIKRGNARLRRARSIGAAIGTTKNVGAAAQELAGTIAASGNALFNLLPEQATRLGAVAQQPDSAARRASTAAFAVEALPAPQQARHRRRLVRTVAEAAAAADAAYDEMREVVRTALKEAVKATG